MANNRREAHFKCSSCGKEFALQDRHFECVCGGLIDLSGLCDEFSPSLIDAGTSGLFRYRRLMPSIVDAHWESATMSEGMTGLVCLPEEPLTTVKMDFVMPTLSFKDRGAAVLIAAAKGLGVTDVVQDSSGNAGNSIAAYASRLGIRCEILVPESTSPNKVSQIRAYGANVTIVAGNREDTAKSALSIARSGKYYASHVYNPLFYQGTKTYVYEIWEQLGGKMPDALAVPVGNGTLLMGVYYGLKSLIAGGAIDKYPLIIAVQAANCAPIFEAYSKGTRQVIPIINRGTAAEGIAIAAPMRGNQILSALCELKGVMAVADEDEIETAYRFLARSGIFVEPTSAATLAGANSWMKKSGFKGSLIVPMCGAGLKSLH